jgi:soluble lytic murein transglycosylase
VQLAQDNGWFDRGVFGLAGPGDTRAPDDQRLYTLRFPLAWSDLIHRQAQASGLDPAWISAEIRAESVFDPHAVSSANARGLMQLLPEVGATLAQQLNLPWNGATTLDDPALNIALGSAYLRQLLDRHDGLPYLAIAAYNAGPSAVARWRSQRPALPADLWIETIPYRETRDYVARVLAFSVLYDWRLRGDALPLSDRLLGKTDSPRKRFFCPSSEPVRTPSP